MPEKALLEEMSGSVVFYAPVPASILASAQTVPELANRVAFGSNSFGLKDMPIGVDVYIYASQPPHDLYNPGMVTWTGKLGAIVRAVEGTLISGRCLVWAYSLSPFRLPGLKTWAEARHLEEERLNGRCWLYFSLLSFLALLWFRVAFHRRGVSKGHGNTEKLR